MTVLRSSFVCSSATWQQCPGDGRPDVAFIGRSNVGKSSLINMLTNNRQLAKVSGSPGKTQLINHFLVNDSWYLVDLPGYGFAKTSRQQRANFGRMIRNYILNRQELYCLFLLIDSRHEPQRNDLEFMRWVGENGIPLALIFTKVDKLSQEKLRQNIAGYEKVLQEHWEELPPIFQSSAQTGAGRDQIIEFIEGFINQ